MYDLKGLSQASFSNNNQTSVNLSWNTGDNSVVSVPDNHKIFQICFELIGDCDTKSAVQIVGTPLAIEVDVVHRGAPQEEVPALFRVVPVAEIQPAMVGQLLKYIPRSIVNAAAASTAWRPGPGPSVSSVTWRP